MGQNLSLGCDTDPALVSVVYIAVKIPWVRRLPQYLEGAMGPTFTNLFASCCTSPNFVLVGAGGEPQASATEDVLPWGHSLPWWGSVEACKPHCYHWGLAPKGCHHKEMATSRTTQPRAHGSRTKDGVKGTNRCAPRGWPHGSTKYVAGLVKEVVHDLLTDLLCPGSPPIPVQYKCNTAIFHCHPPPSSRDAKQSCTGRARAMASGEPERKSREPNNTEAWHQVFCMANCQAVS